MLPLLKQSQAPGVGRMNPKKVLKRWPELRQREMLPRHDASMACMDADAVGNARAKVESELARVQNALVVAEEARRKVGRRS